MAVSLVRSQHNRFTDHSVHIPAGHAVQMKAPPVMLCLLLALGWGLWTAPMPCDAQGLPVQYGLLPLGDLTTSDQDGPYNIPPVQTAEVEGMRNTMQSVFRIVLKAVCGKAIHVTKVELPLYPQ